MKALHEETEAIYKENQGLNKQQIALNEEVRRRILLSGLVDVDVAVDVAVAVDVCNPIPGF